MSSSANSDAFGWEDDRNSSVHYSSTLRQQPAPTNFLHGEFHWAGELRQESYVPVGLASNTSSWSSAAFLDPRYSPHGVDAWLGDLRVGVPRPGPLFGAPGGNANAPGTSAMEVAAPVLEQAIPVVQRMLPATQPCLPPVPSWTQAPGPPWQPSSWDHHPVHTARQHGGHSDSDITRMRPENPRVQLAASSVITGHSERRGTPTGHFHSMATPHSVQPSSYGDPVSGTCLLAVSHASLHSLPSFPFLSFPFFFFFRTRTHTLRSIHIRTTHRTLGSHVRHDHVPMSVEKRWHAVQSAYRRRSKEHLESPSGRAQVHVRRPDGRMCMGPVLCVDAAQEHLETHSRVSFRDQVDVPVVRLGSEQGGCDKEASTGVHGRHEDTGGGGRRARRWAVVCLAELKRLERSRRALTLAIFVCTVFFPFLPLDVEHSYCLLGLLSDRFSLGR
ncbi:hypothetical protein EV363DRAFT_802364 [Boletus edulis]|nr:hypothetical protein EV363DRAFT_802364 [Boletus edulis]